MAKFYIDSLQECSVDVSVGPKGLEVVLGGNEDVWKSLKKAVLIRLPGGNIYPLSTQIYREGIERKIVIPFSNGTLQKDDTRAVSFGVQNARGGWEEVSKCLFLPNEIVIEEKKRFTAYEMRELCATKKLPKILDEKNKLDVSKYKNNEKKQTVFKTDLHTHYPALITGNDLFEKAIEGHPYYWRTKDLRKAGIDVSKYEKNLLLLTARDIPKEYTVWYVPPRNTLLKNDTSLVMDISKLTPEDKEILIQRLSIPQNKQVNFQNMEDYYDLRDPFTKNIHLFKQYLIAIAKNYQQQNITQVSISFSKIMNPEWLFIADQCITQIEKDTNVNITFLVGISRLEQNYARKEKIISAIKASTHPCVDGIDILGTEVNSTKAFYSDIKSALEYSQTMTSNFTVRIHAGENPYHPENVRVALGLLGEFPHCFLRVGHGIYGAQLDESTLEIVKKNKNNVIIEMNPDSNFALNHLDTYGHYPLDYYVENDIPITLGTDGFALYRTDHTQMLNNLKYISKDPERALKHIEKSEQTYLYHKKNVSNWKIENGQHEKKIAENKNESLDVAFKKAYKIQENTEEIEKRNNKIKQTLAIEQSELAQSLGSKLQSEEYVKTVFEGKTPIMIMGEIDDNSAEVEKHIKKLLNACNPANVYFVTNGTKAGLNGILDKCIGEYNRTQKEPEKQLNVCAYLGTDTLKEELTKNLTYVVQTKEPWYRLPNYLSTEKIDIKEGGMRIIALSGDQTSRDMIQIAHNLKCGERTYVLPLAYSAHAKRNLPSSTKVYVTSDALLEEFNHDNPGLFKKNFSEQQETKTEKTPPPPLSSLLNKQKKNEITTNNAIKPIKKHH